MTTSTSTLLTVVNKVLTNVGERQVTNLSSSIAVRAVNSIEEAIREIENLDDWSWTRDKLSASSWVNEVATLPSFTRIHDVLFVSPTTRKVLVYIDPVDFALQELTSFTITTDSPTYYTINNDTSVSVSPYPVGSTLQDYVVFILSSTIPIPTTASSTFNIPERYLTLVTKLASYNLAVRHLDDKGIASNFRSEFEAMLVMIRSRGNLTPTSGTNMFKRRTRRDYML